MKRSMCDAASVASCLCVKCVLKLLSFLQTAPRIRCHERKQWNLKVSNTRYGTRSSSPFSENIALLLSVNEFKMFRTVVPGFPHNFEYKLPNFFKTFSILLLDFFKT